MLISNNIILSLFFLGLFIFVLLPEIIETNKLTEKKEWLGGEQVDFKLKKLDFNYQQQQKKIPDIMVWSLFLGQDNNKADFFKICSILKENKIKYYLKQDKKGEYELRVGPLLNLEQVAFFQKKLKALKIVVNKVIKENPFLEA